ncbi:hypothetical protein POUND7_007227 [Theobroma cacao]
MQTASSRRWSSSSYCEPGKSDYCLCLAIHAPRKGIVEVWQMRSGPCLLTIQCGKGYRLLQPTYWFGLSLDSPYVPLEVFFVKRRLWSIVSVELLC